MWPVTANSGGWRSPQALGGTRNEYAGTGAIRQKNPNREWLGFRYWWRRRPCIKLANRLIYIN